MANHTVTETEITVHGRGSLTLPFRVNNADGTPLDISTRTIFFEVDGVPIREQLVADPNDALGLRIILERTQIATLKTTPLKFSMVDETAGEELAVVLWEGTISRKGYKGEPDAVAE